MTNDPAASFATLLETIRHLRDPEAGCPWDLEQTHRSLREALVEESYEALEALTSGEPAAMVEELGDLLMQVLLNAQIGKDEGTFEIGDVLAQLNEKLVRRHPHVFGEERARTAAEGISHWERMKASEREMRGGPPRSMLGGVPRAMPALAYAYAVLGRARRAGFDWDDPDTIFEKLAEEVREFAEAAPGPARRGGVGRRPARGGRSGGPDGPRPGAGPPGRQRSLLRPLHPYRGGAPQSRNNARRHADSRQASALGRGETSSVRRRVASHAQVPLVPNHPGQVCLDSVPLAQSLPFPPVAAMTFGRCAVASRLLPYPQGPTSAPSRSSPAGED